MSCKKLIMQGDQYNLLFQLTLDDEKLNLETVSKIQFVVGDLVKMYPGDVIYDIDNDVFKFPITQEESVTMIGLQHVQIRLKDIDGFVYGKVYGNIDLQYSTNKDIL